MAIMSMNKFYFNFKKKLKQITILREIYYGKENSY